MVAMMNKSILPSKYHIPCLGEVNVLSKLLIVNIEFILFRGPFACFENNWHLKEDYKRATKRNDLASQLSKHIAWFAMLNLVLSPIIFLWQLLYFFFSYAAVSLLCPWQKLFFIKPSIFFSRFWRRNQTF